ncbi:putative ATP-dependent RNA helicase DDX52 [Frankliniella fusca]|uniref:Probable ATP-dependent RNA helicase DDX52 n=1 Tax=Frankliniella fusca TaxID=407009 RepID=A0AAE1LC61_9NEOP|nr:putative ATP-dependent RNA helicase DDX52 [Frankliniella fusca]
MDAHDLFRKLTSGVRFSKGKRTKPVVHTEKPTEPVKIKQEEDFNAAEEWMNAGDGSSSDDESNIASGSDMESDEEDSDNSDKFKKSSGHGSIRNGFKPTNDSDSESDSDNSIDGPITLLGNLSSDKATKEKQVKQKSKKKLSPEEKLKAQEEEKINILRKKLRLSVSGDGVPPPIESFDELQTRFGVSDNLINNLRKSGYSEPTPIQSQAWPIMLKKNRQVLACAPTGSGKTAAFLLPLLHHLRGLRHDGIRAVIVSPTRELARQTFRECSRLAENSGLNIHIISKVNLSNAKLTLEKTNKLDILITTPNRLVFLLKQEPAVLSLKSVRWLIVDESDKLFEAGPRGFRDQLAAIYQACDSQHVKRGMFSATHGAHVAKWCKQNLAGLIAVTVGHRNTTADKVQQELVFVGSEQGKLIAMRELISKGLQPPVLIFVQSKERAKELFSELLYDGINVDVIHADRTQLQRDNVVKSFREGKIWVLICTELMGRGIDFKGVNLVINFDFPPSAVSYIHRIGRTGRAGREGKAITFFTQSDAPILRSIATVMKDSGCDVPQYMLEMKKVSKKTKREREKYAPERNSISTVPKREKQKQDQLHIKIENAKRKKKGLPPLPPKPSKAKKRKAENEEGGDKKKRKVPGSNKSKKKQNVKQTTAGKQQPPSRKSSGDKMKAKKKKSKSN